MSVFFPQGDALERCARRAGGEKITVEMAAFEQENGRSSYVRAVLVRCDPAQFFSGRGRFLRR